MEWETLGYIVFMAAMWLIVLAVLYFKNRERIKKAVDRFLNAHLLHYYIFVVLAVIGITLLIIGIGLLVLNVPGAGILLMAIGGLLSFQIFSWLRELFPPKEPKKPENPIQEELAEKRPLMVKWRNYSILSGIGCTLIVLLVFFFVGLSQVNQLNDYVRDVLDDPVDENGYYTFYHLEQALKDSSIVQKCFVGGTADVRNRRNQLDAYVLEYAAQIEKKIDGLEPVTKINSEEHNNQIRGAISDVNLDDTMLFDSAVLEHVSNYDKFVKYTDDYYSLLSRYEVSCGTCYGSGTVSCSACDGRGKKLVTWYSEGDWGDTSYSSYTCKTCGGSGSRSCHCGGRSRYVFEDGR